MYTAWVDESGSDRRRDPGTYILGATLIPPERVDECRDAMRGLLLRGQKKLHWYHEVKRHTDITHTIAALDLRHIVAVRSRPTDPGRLERQRRLCMEHLVAELTALGISQVIAESRGPRDDMRDVDALDNLRRQRVLKAPMRVQHLAGPADPVLWIADAVCGMITRHRCGDGTHLSLLKDNITVLQVER